MGEIVGADLFKDSFYSLYNIWQFKKLGASTPNKLENQHNS